MSKITIREVDETTVGNVIIESTDVVYIPGFSVMSPTDDQVVGQPHVPQLCRTISEFENYFGAVAPTFSTDQAYPSEFDSKAVPTDIGGTPKSMFKKDDPDPSYIYAKELLALGLPVLYERVNEFGENISVDIMYDELASIFEKVADTTLLHQFSLAPPFDGTQKYDVDAVCSYDNQNYKCIDAVAAPGSGEDPNTWDGEGGVSSSFELDTSYQAFTLSIVNKAFYEKFYNTGKYRFVYQKDSTANMTFSATLAGRMAPEYDSTQTYALNSHCTYGGNVFENIVAITTPEQFNSSHWVVSSFVPTSFVTINWDTWFTQHPLDAVEYTYTYDGTNSVWKLSSTTVNLNALGIKVSGTFNDGDTITVNNAYNLGWVCNSVYYSDIGSCGITLTLGTGASLQENDEFTIYLEASDPLLLDRGLYSFKYLTSGGYPTFEYNGSAISKLMASLCYRRGDAVALIDHTDNPARLLTGTTSVYYAAQQPANMLPSAHQSFGTMFTPAVQMALNNVYRGWSWTDSVTVRLPSTIVFPPSFAYLSCLASAIKVFPNWNAIAGATRGKVIGLVAPRTVKALTNAIADSFTPDTVTAINPITNVKPYGQCIWGNRTLVDNSIKQGTTAVSFLNIRNLVSDVKKRLYVACQSLLFEQNTDVLWVNFLSLVTPTLDRMVSGFGIHNYKIIKLPNSDKTQINVRIRLYPIYAVESFDITIYLNDKGVYLDSEPDNV